MKSRIRFAVVILTVAALLCGLCVPSAAEGKTYSIGGDDVPTNILVADDEGLTFNFGVCFQVKEAGTLTEVRRIFHGVEHGEFNVSVFRSTAAVLEYVWTGVWNVPEASGDNLHWSTFALPVEIRLEPGVNYCVCVETNESTTHYMVTENYYAGCPAEASDVFIFDEFSGRFAVGDGMKYPENVGANGRTFFVDVTFLPDSEKAAPGGDETAAPGSDTAAATEAPTAAATEAATTTPTEPAAQTAAPTEAPATAAAETDAGTADTAAGTEAPAEEGCASAAASSALLLTAAAAAFAAGAKRRH